jgi:hypothetical protein
MIRDRIIGIIDRLTEAVMYRPSEMPPGTPPTAETANPTTAQSQDGSSANESPRMGWMGWIGITICVWSLILSLYDDYSRAEYHDWDFVPGHRFQKDNATGAMANAAEHIQRAVENDTPHFLYSLIGLVIFALDRVRAAVTWQAEILRRATRRKTPSADSTRSGAQKATTNAET